MATLSGLLGSSVGNQLSLTSTDAGQLTTVNRPVLTITEQAKLISLHGYTTGSNQSSTMRQHGVFSGYQVPPGKKLLIFGVNYGRTGGGGIANQDQMGLQGMDTDLGLSFSSAVTNPDTSRSDPGNLGQVNTSDGKYGFIPYFYVLRENKFLQFFANTGQYLANISALEVDATDTSFTGGSYSLAGQNFSNLGRLKTLYWGSNSSGPVATPRETGFSSGYTPPTGKVFVGLASYLVIRAASASDVYTLNTAGSDIGLYSVTAPSTPDDPGTAGLYGGGVNTNEVVYRRHQIVLTAGRYFYASAGNSRTEGTIYGYEIDEGATEF